MKYYNRSNQVLKLEEKVKRILIILLLVFALVGGLFARGQQEAVSIMPGSGRIVYLEGEVTLNGTFRRDWQFG